MDENDLWSEDRSASPQANAFCRRFKKSYVLLFQQATPLKRTLQIVIISV